MDIGVGCEAVIAVPQPHLNILHRIAQIQEDGRAGMPKVVETDGAQGILFQQLLEFLAYKVRLQEHAHIVHAYEVQVVPVVGGTT